MLKSSMRYVRLNAVLILIVAFDLQLMDRSVPPLLGIAMATISSLLIVVVMVDEVRRRWRAGNRQWAALDDEDDYETERDLEPVQNAKP